MSEMSTDLAVPGGDMTDEMAMAIAATSNSGISGRKKAAILLCSLGPERAAKIFSCLGEGEIESLSLEMTQVGMIDPNESDEVLREVAETAMVAQWAGTGGFEYAREVLEKAVGEERSAEIMRRLSAVIEKRPFDFLRRSTPDQISSFLANEAPEGQHWSLGAVLVPDCGRHKWRSF